METKRFGLLSSAIATSLLLSACGAEQAPAEDNTPPSLSMGNSSLSVEEGKVGYIDVVISDDFSSFEDENLSFELLDADGVKASESKLLEGTLSFDKEESRIAYTAPWLSSRKSLNENFTAKLTDQHGEVVQRNISVEVSDINDPVNVKVNPPSRAYGYENTQEDETLNFWLSEKDALDVKFTISESDGDELSVDYTVTEGLVFENQITASQSEEGNSITLSLPATSISTPSESFSLSLIIDDGDDTVTATANVTLVNKPSLSWHQDSPSSVSERNGATLKFTSSEDNNYPGEYSAELVSSEGETLPFDAPVTVDGSTGEVFIGASSGFQGDTSAVLNVTLKNTISHAGGESYVETTTLSRTLNFVDDRDDGFNIAVDEFYDLKEKVEETQLRRDEERIASAFASYLFLEGYATYRTINEMKDSVAESLDKNYQDLSENALNIVAAIDNGAGNDEIENMISDFKKKAKQIGRPARESLNDSVDTITAALAEGEEVALAEIKDYGDAQEFDGALTNYIGNGDYGSYKDKEKTEWVFLPEYAYLSVVDYSNQFCF